MTAYTLFLFCLMLLYKGLHGQRIVTGPMLDWWEAAKKRIRR